MGDRAVSGQAQVQLLDGDAAAGSSRASAEADEVEGKIHTTVPAGIPARSRTVRLPSAFFTVVTRWPCTRCRWLTGSGRRRCGGEAGIAGRRRGRCWRRWGRLEGIIRAPLTSSATPERVKERSGRWGR